MENKENCKKMEWDINSSLPCSFSEVGVVSVCSQGLACVSSVIMIKMITELPHATKHGVLNMCNLLHNFLCGFFCCRHLVTCCVVFIITVIVSNISTHQPHSLWDLRFTQQWLWRILSSGMFIWDISELLPDYTALHPRR